VVADPADGKVLGTWRLSRGSGPSRVISNGLLLVPASGEAAFTYPLDFAPRRAAIAAYDVRNGRRRWKLDLAKGGTVPGITTNGTDLFLSLGTMAKGSELARYELATGRQVWRRRLPEGTTDKSVRRADNIYHLIVSGSVLLGRVFDGELIAVDTKDGELLWTMPVRHHLLSDLMLAGRYLILVAGQSVQVYRTVDSSKDDRSSSTTWGSSNCPGILGTPITVTVKGIPASGVSSSSSSSSCACVQTPIRTDAAVQEKIHGTAHPIRPAAE
jgi:outer membrane protein assembly factor BamB